MSIDATNWAWALVISPPAKKLILMDIADTADSRGLCWPGQQRIAKRTCCSVRTVRRYLAELESEDLISRSARRRPNGSRTSDMIKLNLHAVDLACCAEQLATGGRAKRPPVARPEPPENRKEIQTHHPIDEQKNASKENRHENDTSFGTRIDPAWQPSQEDRNCALKRGWLNDEIDQQIELFRDHYRAAVGERARSADWSAKWRNWFRRAEQYNTGVRRTGSGATGRKRTSPYHQVNEAMHRVLDRRAHENGGR